MSEAFLLFLGGVWYLFFLLLFVLIWLSGLFIFLVLVVSWFGFFVCGCMFLF